MAETRPQIRPTPVEIQKRIDDHRLWLKTYGEEGVRLACSEDEILDLSALFLEKVDLSFARIAGAKFSNSCLREAWMVKSDLSVSTFHGADLTDAHFEGADLSFATLIDAQYVGARFEGACLDGTCFTRQEAMEARERVAAALRKELAGDDPSPIE